MKILLAADGSEASLRAGERLTAFVRELRDPPRLTLINVHDDTALRHAAELVGHKAVEDYLHELSDTDLKPLRAFFDAQSVAYDVQRAIGEIAPTVVKAATAGQFDLIVMGSKGRTNLGNLLLGSVATKVLALSTIPVMLIR